MRPRKVSRQGCIQGREALDLAKNGKQSLSDGCQAVGDRLTIDGRLFPLEYAGRLQALEAAGERHRVHVPDRALQLREAQLPGAEEIDHAQRDIVPEELQGLRPAMIFRVCAAFHSPGKIAEIERKVLLKYF